jgi:hypothetical protein
VKAPYYESRWIRANHPDRPLALWVRETLLRTSGGAECADVWVMAYDPDGAGNCALKQPHSIEEAQFRAEPWTAAIGSTTLDDDHARGLISDPLAAAWDLRITGGGEPVKLLANWQYSSWVPSAKTQVRAPLARFDGQAVVEDHEFDLAGWTGSVNHNWGRRHTPVYAFGQVCGFDAAPTSSLEIVTARAAVGSVMLPPVTLLVFRHDGREFAVRSPISARRTHGVYRPFDWTFSARFEDAELEGELSAQSSDMIGLHYIDTNGKIKFCYNSAVAICRIRLSGSAFGAVELTATRRAMLEILTDKPQQDVPLLA